MKYTCSIPLPTQTNFEHRWTGCSHKHHVNTRTWKDDWNGLISRSSFWTLAFSPGYIVFPPVRKTFWTRTACCSFGYLQGTKPNFSLSQGHPSYEPNCWGILIPCLQDSLWETSFTSLTWKLCSLSRNSGGGKKNNFLNPINQQLCRAGILTFQKM